MSTSTTPRVGHVHLRVSDLDRSIAFYADILGFAVTLRYGGSAAFLAAGDYHHHIGLNTWESLDATPPPTGHTGLYHTAFLYPDRQALAVVMARVVAAGIPFDGAADHGVSEAVYLRDPDENGVELYVDKPMTQWPRNDVGALQMVNDRLDVAGLLALARSPSQN
ncbi:VOC family protein [Roseobacter sp. CCS2]|uniref:VOC family protein n=1 Tax=Roseobacter sp. CCS2 TaxID=391593 RepID=UPI0000F3E43C|nr:VOC family protein [Roseobacter sp. CCS2]EBA12286.1 biphenyl-2,3-diol 1,2-dioxygenase III [Roseobacter sp. CCS2]